MPARTRTKTETTPTAPLGKPAVAVEPIVEQIADADDSAMEVERPVAELLADPEWLYDQVHHKVGCPMIDAPFQGSDARGSQPQVIGRAQRMEYYDATEPRTQDNPMPRTYRMIRCSQCGAAARIKLPRED